MLCCILKASPVTAQRRPFLWGYCSYRVHAYLIALCKLTDLASATYDSHYSRLPWLQIRLYHQIIARELGWASTMPRSPQLTFFIFRNEEARTTEERSAVAKLEHGFSPAPGEATGQAGSHRRTHALKERGHTSTICIWHFPCRKICVQWRHVCRRFACLLGVPIFLPAGGTGSSPSHSAHSRKAKKGQSLKIENNVEIPPY